MTRLLTTNELAKKLNFKPTTIRKWVAIGKVEAINTKQKGSKDQYRFDYDEVMNILRGK